MFELGQALIDIDSFLLFSTPLRLLFVAINSFYSFYWDIYHDWNLIQVQPISRNSPLINSVPTGASAITGPSHSRMASAPMSPSASKSGSLNVNDSLGTTSLSSPSMGNGSIHNSASNGAKKPTSSSQHHVQTRRFGMRSFLHYEDPAFYYMAVILDFLLRTTWMLKLVSNIQIEEYEGGVFTMECLEVLRRWIWVLFRMESEMVKRSGYADSGPLSAGLVSSGSGVGGDMDIQDSNNVILMEDLESWQQK